MPTLFQPSSSSRFNLLFLLTFSQLLLNTVQNTLNGDNNQSNTTLSSNQTSEETDHSQNLSKLQFVLVLMVFQSIACCFICCHMQNRRNETPRDVELGLMGRGEEDKDFTFAIFDTIPIIDINNKDITHNPPSVKFSQPLTEAEIQFLTEKGDSIDISILNRYQSYYDILSEGSCISTGHWVTYELSKMRHGETIELVGREKQCKAELEKFLEQKQLGSVPEMNLNPILAVQEIDKDNTFSFSCYLASNLDELYKSLATTKGIMPLLGHSNRFNDALKVNKENTVFYKVGLLELEPSSNKQRNIEGQKNHSVIPINNNVKKDPKKESEKIKKNYTLTCSIMEKYQYHLRRIIQKLKNKMTVVNHSETSPLNSSHSHMDNFFEAHKKNYANVDTQEMYLNRKGMG